MLLAIRTILVTTRAAVGSNARDLGDGEMARASAREGLRLLDDLGPRLASNEEPRVRDAFQSARAEMLEMASAPEPGRAEVTERR